MTANSQSNTLRNREAWLIELAEKLRGIFETNLAPLPAVIRLSCGFTSKGGKGDVIGQCHHASSSADGATEIFVRPDIADALEVAAVVLHELVHAAVGVENQHNKVFKKLATSLGLVGKMKATKAGEVALKFLRPIVEELGPFPHARLTFSSGAGAKKKAGEAEQKNVTCPHCGFRAKIRVDQMEIGRLVCPQDDALLLTKDEGGGE